MKRILPVLLAAVLAGPAGAQQELPLRVQGVLAHRDIPGNALSIHVENLSRGEVVLAWNAEILRTPASIMKLLTTLVALEELGPAYTWKTEAYLAGTLGDGHLQGDLLLKGYGDPYLVTERLWQLQRRLRLHGVRHIDGDLLLDDSWFDVGAYDPAAFDREPLRAYNVAPNALMTNYKVVRYLFSRASDGKGVDIVVEPPLPNLQLVNRLSQANGGCHGYQRGIAVSHNDAYDTIAFDGRFPRGCRLYAMDRSALDHNAFTYGLFRSLWEESGGTLAGSYRNARAPDGAQPDLVFESLPLTDIISKVNKHSNNVMARQLLFTLAAEKYGPPGTEPNGRAAIAAWLRARGMVFDELKLDNGAGLSRDASMTAAHMAALLRYAYRSRYMPEFLSSLSISGLDGTLSRRLRDGSLQGVAHMKTGSLDHVSSLAGYLLGRSGERYSVVVMLNHRDAHRGPGEELQDALLRWLREK